MPLCVLCDRLFGSEQALVDDGLVGRLDIKVVGEFGDEKTGVQCDNEDVDKN